VFEPQRKFCDV